MSLALTALRLQAIAALNAHPVIGRLCKGRIYDSRIGDFDHREPVPVIVVTTEELEGDAWSANNGGAPFDDRCNLTIEIAMNALVPAKDEGGADVFAIATPTTDRELEAVLNLIAWCAELVLTLGLAHPRDRQQLAAGKLLMDAVTRRVTKRSIVRFSSDETAERLAIHLVTYAVELKGEDLDLSDPAPTGLYAGLPEPLRRVCEAAAEGSSARETCDLIAKEFASPAPDRLQSACLAPNDPPRPGTIPVDADFPIP